MFDWGRRKRRLTTILVAVLFALLVIDRASLLVAPCGSGGGGYSEHKNPNDNNCAERQGVIIAGFWWLYDEPPEFWTAIASIAIAFFTWTLWRSGEKTTRLTRMMGRIAHRQFLISGQQTDIQRKQHALGRLQYFVTHRPRLKIRHVSIETADHIGHPTIFFDNGETVRGGLAVVNVGGSEATIVDTRYRIFFTNTGLPLSAPYDPPNGRTNLLLTDQVLAIGESCAVPIIDTVVMGPDAHTGTIILRRFDREEWVIYVMGTIRYR